MLIETIKNHPRTQVGRVRKTLQDGAFSWSRQVDMPRIRALAAECRLINSRWIYRGDIAVLSLTFLPLLAIRASYFPTICFYNPLSTSSCYEQELEIYIAAINTSLKKCITFKIIFFYFDALQAYYMGRYTNYLSNYLLMAHGK